jgi:sodium-dependent dicarboxylate transporter 2/3/5
MEFMTQYSDNPLNSTQPGLYMGCTTTLFLETTLKATFKKKNNPESQVTKMIKARYEDLGAMTFHEIGVLGLFSTLVVIWFMRKPGFLPGWAEALQWTKETGSVVSIGSATPTIRIVMFFFIIPPNHLKDPSGPALLQWDSVQRKFPWGIILLMGGGFALAEGAKVSCLTNQIGAALEGIGHLPPPLILLVLCLVTSVVSQIASNSAGTSMIVPVVLAMAQSLKINPAYLALGITLTASHAFMMPVSTPPNAIVFTAGGLTVKDMVAVGAILNILCISTSFLCLHTYGSVMFDLDTVPLWANVTVVGSTMCL